MVRIQSNHRAREAFAMRGHIFLSLFVLMPYMVHAADPGMRAGGDYVGVHIELNLLGTEAAIPVNIGTVRFKDLAQTIERVFHTPVLRLTAPEAANRRLSQENLVNSDRLVNDPEFGIIFNQPSIP